MSKTRSSFDRLMTHCAKRFSPRRDGSKVVYIRNISEGQCRKYRIDGVFDDEFEAVAFDGEARISSRTTQLGIHKHALPFAPARGDKVVIGKEIYCVAEAQPDSEYGLNLVLRK